ncbi:MAG: hypothetical protein GY865_00420 [candidate division Zixibacteria bacterium]|nr:hypothetical protein [candidate division Zixibacteria bacterium]
MSIESVNNIPQFTSSDIFTKYDTDSKLSLFLDQVLSYNKKVNIVSRETSLEKLKSIAAECLAPIELGVDIKGKIFDIGSGGGFPALILMLARPGIEGVLIERTGKKAKFLEDIIKQFDLSGIVHNRDFSEIAPQLDKNSFDYGLMKYVRMEKKLLRPALQLLNPDGKYLYYSRMITDDKYGINHFRAIEACYYLDDTKQVRTINIITKLK